MLSVKYIDISKLGDEEFHHFLMQLPAAILTSVGSYTDSRTQALSLYGKVLLGEMLCEMGLGYTLEDISINEWGKPMINGEVWFSIAHSGDIVVCACCDKGDLGIDIEVIKPIDLTDYQDYFTEQEWSLVQWAEDKMEVFYRLWVRKEAVAKAVGKGVNIPLNEIDVRSHEVLCEGAVYHVSNLSVTDDYVCAIATVQEYTGVYAMEFIPKM